MQRKQIFIRHKLSQFFISIMWGVMCIFIPLIFIQFTNANDIININNNTDCKNGTHYFQCKDGKHYRELMDLDK